MSRVLRALGVTAALLVVCSLLGTGTAAATDRTSGRAADASMTGAPPVGACYDLTLTQAGGRTTGTAPSSCRAGHTLAVTAIGMLPSSLDYRTMDLDHPPAAYYATVQKVCRPAVNRLIAGPVVRARTLWTDFLFVPSDAEIAAGARWFSCQVGMPSGGRLLALPAGQPRRITGPIPSRVAACVRQVKGGYAEVPCTVSHQWRTTYSVLVHRAATDKNAETAAGRVCTEQLRTQNWLWKWSWVSARSFVVACSRKTRH